jgi:hypothetical protein
VTQTVELSLFDEMSSIGQRFQNGANHETRHQERFLLPSVAAVRTKLPAVMQRAPLS